MASSNVSDISPGDSRTRRRELTSAAVAAAIGAWVGFLTGPNAMVAATNSNFLAVLPEALGVTRTQISGILALSVWGVALLVPFMGRAMDAAGVRNIFLPGSILFGVCFLLFGQMREFWHFIALQAMLAITASMHSSVGYAKLLSLWFDRNRGLVLGLCVALGAGLGQTIMPQLVQWLIDTYSWRGGYTGIGLIVLVAGVPLLFVLARPPRGVRVEKEEAATPAEGLTRAEALRRPEFYLVFFAIMLGSMSLISTLIHGVPMLLERGVAVSLATTVLSFAFAGVVFGEMSAGFLVDRINTPRIILPYFAIAFAGLMVVHSASTSPLLLVGGAMLGLGLGCEIGLNAYMVSRYFGLKFFGSIYGLTFAASNLGIGSGVFLMGYLSEATGSYDIMRYVFGGTMAASVLCIALLPPFRFKGKRH